MNSFEHPDLCQASQGPRGEGGSPFPPSKQEQKLPITGNPPTQIHHPLLLKQGSDDSLKTKPVDNALLEHSTPFISTLFTLLSYYGGTASVQQRPWGPPNLKYVFSGPVLTNEMRAASIFFSVFPLFPRLECRHAGST